MKSPNDNEGSGTGPQPGGEETPAVSAEALMRDFNQALVRMLQLRLGSYEDAREVAQEGDGRGVDGRIRNPDDPAQASAMLAYSPYQNVRKGTRYPPFLVTISTEDNRVGPSHARKLAYRLQEAGSPTYFCEDEEGGHGVSDAFRNPELMALRMSFLIDTLMPKD